jgi:signal transduction histidine kinase
MMSETKKALVVDDDDLDLRASVDVLAADGWTVKTATNGEDALSLLAAEPFDLVVTDIVMRGVSGFEVLQAARQADPDSISIAMTSFGSIDSAIDALNFGAYSYLLKPCDAQAFRHCIRKGLEKQRLTKELRLRNRELETINRELDNRVQAKTAELQNLNHRILTEMASLREVDELKTSFLNNVSHDLKNPLTTIKGYLAYILEEGTTKLEDETRDGLKAVSKAASHMEYLIGQILEAAKLTSGTLRLDRAEFSVPDMIEEVAVAARIQAGAAGVSLDARCEPGLKMTADRGRMLQIFGNLLGNACKFTPPGGKIALSAALVSGRLVFKVADTGPGIAPEHLPRIFERFYQVAPGSSQAMKGLGLGLRITKDLVELHGGSLSVESVLDKGTTFTISMPHDLQPVI